MLKNSAKEVSSQGCPLPLLSLFHFVFLFTLLLPSGRIAWRNQLFSMMEKRSTQVPQARVGKEEAVTTAAVAHDEAEGKPRRWWKCELSFETVRVLWLTAFSQVCVWFDNTPFFSHAVLQNSLDASGCKVSSKQNYLKGSLPLTLEKVKP